VRMGKAMRDLGWRRPNKAGIVRIDGKLVMGYVKGEQPWLPVIVATRAEFGLFIEINDGNEAQSQSKSKSEENHTSEASRGPEPDDQTDPAEGLFDHADDQEPKGNPESEIGSTWQDEKYCREAFHVALTQALAEHGKTINDDGGEWYAVREKIVNAGFAAEVLKRWPGAGATAIKKAWGKTYNRLFAGKIIRYILHDGVSYLSNYDRKLERES